MEEKETLQKELELIKSSRKEEEELNNLKTEIATEKKKMFNAKHDTLGNINHSLGKGLLSIGKGIINVLDNFTKPSDKSTQKTNKSEWKLPNQDDINKII